MKFSYKIFAQVIIFIIFSLNITSLKAMSSSSTMSYIILDNNSGEILDGYNYKKTRFPASLTKLMTLYILFNEIDKGNLTMDSELKISKYASSMQPSKIYLQPGSTIKVSDAINAMIVKSANDVSVVVAEAIAGSEVKFANLMNETAKSLSMKKTRFVNASGLHNKNHYSSAYDMALLSRAMISHHYKYYSLFSQKNFKYHNKTYQSTNHLLDANSNIDGMKTGFTHKSGFSIAISYKEDNSRLVAVFLGYPSIESRDNSAIASVIEGYQKSAMLRKEEIAKQNSSIQLPDFILNPGNNAPSGTIAEGSEDYTVKYNNNKPKGNYWNNVANKAHQNTSISTDDNLTSSQWDSARLKSTKDVYVNLGRFKDKKTAEFIMLQAQKNHYNNFKDKEPSIKAEVKGNGDVSYRLDVKMTDKQEAKEACSKLQQNGNNCTVSEKISGAKNY